LLLFIILTQWSTFYFIRFLKIILIVLSPLGYRIKKAGQLLITFLHLKHLISDLSHEDQETLGYLSVSPTISREEEEAVPGGVKNAFDQRCLIEEVIDD
jgi:hypothetical protein